MLNYVALIARILSAGVGFSFLLSRLGQRPSQRHGFWLPIRVADPWRRIIHRGSVFGEIAFIALIGGAVGSADQRSVAIAAVFLFLTIYGSASILRTGDCGCASPRANARQTVGRLVTRNCVLAGLMLLGTPGLRSAAVYSHPKFLVLPALAPISGWIALTIWSRWRGGEAKRAFRIAMSVGP